MLERPSVRHANHCDIARSRHVGLDTRNQLEIKAPPSRHADAASRPHADPIGRHQKEHVLNLDRVARSSVPSVARSEFSAFQAMHTERQSALRDSVKVRI